MAFHVACPITCKRICFCSLGFPIKLQSSRAKNDFLSEISRLEDFLKDPWLFRVKDGATVQIPVPKLPPPPPLPPLVHPDDAAAVDAAEELLSAQTKRAALQKKAAVASLAAEDFARRFESGAFLEPTKDPPVEDQLQVITNTNVNANAIVPASPAVNANATATPTNANVNVMCRLCFSGENEGTERAKKMLPCRNCGKKYHRNCLKTWSQHRDLFHWSSWACPSCRICEVCRRAGEPNKFKFCKRCDGAFHCYCMQPPHKNVSSGPYLCPKHTKCHSCASNVPGNGLSVRWFLGYTCCDACGRLFTKGNYCPVCLKVYRDSESTPMVCCDVCQRWVHIQCDGISDERYLQFQMDGNLPYTCPTCRGECYQVRDLDDAVHELWRRRDEADKDLIASLRAAAGLPAQEEIFAISPFSDDEDNGPGAGRSTKFSYRSVADCSPRKIKESSKKSSSKKSVKKKGHQASLDKIPNKLEDNLDPELFGRRRGEEKDHSDSPELIYSPITGNYSSPGRNVSAKDPGILKHKYMSEVTGNNMDRRGTALPIRIKKISDSTFKEESGKVASKPKAMKGTKLVIHLGGRNKTITNSPRSDSSSHHREELTTLSGNEAVSQGRTADHTVERVEGAAFSDEGYGVDIPNEMEEVKPRERNVIKLGKGKFGALESYLKSEKGNGVFSPETTPLVSSRRRNEGVAAVEELHSTISESEVSSRRYPEKRLDISGDMNRSDKQAPLSLDVSSKGPRSLIRLKMKSPYPVSWAPTGEEERGSVKGQRSKRKRPLPLLDESKPQEEEEEDVTASNDNLRNEIMDANWILKKLGKDAVGKRVEVHQQSDNSWHKAVVSDFVEETSMLSVDLDDGRARTMELGKQGIRLVPQKQKRVKI